MPNTLSEPWVKNVYNLWAARGQNGAFLSTVILPAPTNTQGLVNKSLVLPRFTPRLFTVVSTGNFARFHLLIPSFPRFPQHLLLLRLKKKSER